MRTSYIPVLTLSVASGSFVLFRGPSGVILSMTWICVALIRGLGTATINREYQYENGKYCLKMNACQLF